MDKSLSDRLEGAEVGLTYIAVCASAWCNDQGVGIDYGWDGERFATRQRAIKHGYRLRESDDFNIGVLQGDHLVSFDWMHKPTGEDAASMRKIASQLDLKFSAKKANALLKSQEPEPTQQEPAR